MEHDFMWQWMPRLIGGGSFFLGTAIAVSAVWYTIESYRARRWPWMVGKILSLERKDTTDLSESQQRSSHVFVRYAYEVDGQAYEGTVINRSYAGGPDEQDNAALERLLQPGQQVRVYYRRSRPGYSLLAVGVFNHPLMFVFVGIVFAAAGIMVVTTPVGSGPSFVFIGVIGVAAMAAAYFMAFLNELDYSKGITVIE